MKKPEQTPTARPHSARTIQQELVAKKVGRDADPPRSNTPSVFSLWRGAVPGALWSGNQPSPPFGEPSPSPCPASNWPRPALTYLRPGTIWLACAAGFVRLAMGAEPLLPPMNGARGDFAPRRAGAEVGATVRISVTNEGLYRLTQPELTGVGMKSGDLVGSQIRLYCRTQEVAIIVSSNGLWTTNDYLLFFGTGFDGYYTSTNVYWLGTGGSGARMATRPAPPFAGVQPVTSSTWIAHYDKDRSFRDNYRPDDESLDHWFAGASQNGVVTNFPLTTTCVVTSQPAGLTALLHGYTSADTVNPDHLTRVSVNGTLVGSFDFDGQTTCTGTCSFAGSRLVSNNVVSFTQILASGVSVDRVLIEGFSITYSRLLMAEGGSLIFTGQVGTNNYRVENFSGNSGFWPLDVTTAGAPVLLSGYVVTNVTGGYAVQFGDAPANAGRYAVCHSNGLRNVAKVERVPFRGLSSTNRQADYIVICPYAFRSQAYRLLRYRYGQGLNVAVAPLADIYNEFSYGIADASAIKQFLGFAFHHWKSPVPQYVLLAGNGTYDPKRNLVGTDPGNSYAAPDIIPVHMGPSNERWTALDGWYVQVNGVDNVPDIALGRITATNEAAFKNVIDKIIAFEAVPPEDLIRSQILLVADKKDGSLDFKAACTNIHQTYLTGYGVISEYYDVYGSVPVTRQHVIDDLNSGVFMTSYFGHGAMDQWAGHPLETPSYILSANDVCALTNTDFPIMSMLTCFGGLFQSPTDVKSMVEAFLERPSHGASACIAATAESDEPHNEAFAAGFSRYLFTDKTFPPRIGDAFLAGCAKLWELDPSTQELLFLEVFGDPAMIVNPP